MNIPINKFIKCFKYKIRNYDDINEKNKYQLLYHKIRTYQVLSEDELKYINTLPYNELIEIINIYNIHCINVIFFIK
jgi:hypothetical protein